MERGAGEGREGIGREGIGRAGRREGRGEAGRRKHKHRHQEIEKAAENRRGDSCRDRARRERVTSAGAVSGFPWVCPCVKQCSAVQRSVEYWSLV